jgi:hypothetical protein
MQVHGVLSVKPVSGGRSAETDRDGFPRPQIQTPQPHHGVRIAAPIDTRPDVDEFAMSNATLKIASAEKLQQLGGGGNSALGSEQRIESICHDDDRAAITTRVVAGNGQAVDSR